MVKVMNGGFPGLAKLVAIFTVEVIRMFFYFKGFQMRWEEKCGEEAKIFVWSKKIRCLELKECSTIVDLEIRL
jgi:hypothetical protein